MKRKISWDYDSYLDHDPDVGSERERLDLEFRIKGDELVSANAVRVEPFRDRIYVDLSSGSIGYGQTYGEFSYNGQPLYPGDLGDFLGCRSGLSEPLQFTILMPGIKF